MGGIEISWAQKKEDVNELGSRAIVRGVGLKNKAC